MTIINNVSQYIYSKITYFVSLFWDIPRIQIVSLNKSKYEICMFMFLQYVIELQYDDRVVSANGNAGWQQRHTRVDGAEDLGLNGVLAHDLKEVTYCLVLLFICKQKYVYICSFYWF